VRLIKLNQSELEFGTKRLKSYVTRRNKQEEMKKALREMQTLRAAGL